MPGGEVDTVRNLKHALEKELPTLLVRMPKTQPDERSQSQHETSSPPPPVPEATIERCRDILSQLDQCKVTLPILTETLIGATVNKIKVHPELGTMAKALVLKWKKTVASSSSSSSTTTTTTSTSATATKASKHNQQGATKIKSQPGNNQKENHSKIKMEARLLQLQAKHKDHKNKHRNNNGQDDDEEDDDDVDPALAWQGLSDQRNAICQKLYIILQAAQPHILNSEQDGDEMGTVSERAIQSLTIARTTETECAIYKYSCHDTKQYADKARSICFNLKKNIKLAVAVLLGHVAPDELVTFTAEQMASEDMQQKRCAIAQRLIDSKRLDWDQANEDKINQQCGIHGDLLQASLFTCGRCKSIKTTSTQKQTRSADEPMTVFVLCLNCGKRWKC